MLPESLGYNRTKGSVGGSHLERDAGKERSLRRMCEKEGRGT